MADLKISQLTAVTTPLAGTEQIPAVQSGATKKVTVAQLQAAPIAAQTAKGVVYLNTSKEPTADGNFQYDGKNLGISGAPASWGANFAAYQSGITAWCNDQNNGNAYWGTNFYYAGAGTGTATYIGSYAATKINANLDGTFGIQRAAGGTAGNPISWTNVLTSDTSANVTFNTGNLIQGTAAKGINFTANTPAAGMTSQLLNWYEEGTWTPAISSTSGSITSYTSSGTYTRVGRLVTVNFTFTITNNGTGAAGINVSGIPFNASAAYCANGAGRENAIAGYMVSVGVGSTTQLYVTKYDNTYPGATNASISGSISYII